MRRRGVRVGFIGLASARLPDLFEEVRRFHRRRGTGIRAAPDDAGRVAGRHRRQSGRRRPGRADLPAVGSAAPAAAPVPRPVGGPARRRVASGARQPKLPEFYTYCPHRIQAAYRTRSIGNILDELSYLADTNGPVHVVFRDPLFTQDRDRVLALCDGVSSLALAAACAYAGVRPLTFSLLNVAASAVWAVGLLVVVAWIGPGTSRRSASRAGGARSRRRC